MLIYLDYIHLFPRKILVCIVLSVECIQNRNKILQRFSPFSHTRMDELYVVLYPATVICIIIYIPFNCVQTNSYLYPVEVN